MIKTLNIALLFCAVCVSAQISFSAKANVLIPTSSATWEDFKTQTTNAVEQEGKNIAGFNVGLSMKVDFPTALFVMPEIFYSNFKNEVTISDNISGDQATLQARTSRIDVPVLLGYNLLSKKLSAFAGPVASFNLVKDENYNSFVQKINSEEFTLGYQLGLQSEISKIIISAKYEGAFTKDERKFINTAAGSSQEINYDNRPSIFIVGLGYKF